MLCTIISSLLFLFPLNKAFQYKDQVTMNMSALGLGISVANHSHSFHKNQFRKKLFKYIDIVYMHFFTFRTLFNSRNNLIASGIVTSTMFLLFKLLGKEEFEEYNKKQKYLHVFFHIYSIFMLTLLYENSYWNFKKKIE